VVSVTIELGIEMAADCCPYP